MDFTSVSIYFRRCEIIQRPIPVCDILNITYTPKQLKRTRILKTHMNSVDIYNYFYEDKELLHKIATDGKVVGN